LRDASYSGLPRITSDAAITSTRKQHLEPKATDLNAAVLGMTDMLQGTISGTRTYPHLLAPVELPSKLTELTLPLRAEAAESDLLHPVCDSSHQQFAAEVRRRLRFVENAPLLTKFAEAELREARKRLPANRCILDRAAHACSGAVMR
jgi:hypothetical protein